MAIGGWSAPMVCSGVPEAGGGIGVMGLGPLVQIEQAQAVAQGVETATEKEIARVGGRFEVTRLSTVAVVTRENPQASPLIPTALLVLLMTIGVNRGEESTLLGIVAVRIPERQSVLIQGGAIEPLLRAEPIAVHCRIAIYR